MSSRIPVNYLEGGLKAELSALQLDIILKQRKETLSSRLRCFL